MSISELVEEAKYHEEHGNKIKAIKLYEKIIKIDPNHLNAWLCKGRLHIELHHSNSASICMNKVLEIDPTNQEALGLKKKIKTALKNTISKDLYRSGIYMFIGFIVLLGGIGELIIAIVSGTYYFIISGSISLLVGIAWIGLTRKFQLISDYVDIFSEI